MESPYTVKVTPLEPPFEVDVAFFKFHGVAKELAVSKEDGRRIKELFAGEINGRALVLSAADDGEHILVSAVQ